MERHPSFDFYLDDWRLMAHAYEGERVVKDQGAKYLKPTPAMYQEGYPNGETKGTRMYDAYRSRAVFPPFVTSGVDTLTGLMHRKPAVIEAPPAIEELLDDITGEGEDAQSLLRRINETQLKTGRIGLLVEVPDDQPAGAVTPYICTYGAASMINWNTAPGESGREEVALVVLDESGYEMDPDTLRWAKREKYRVLALDEGGEYVYGVTADDFSSLSGIEFEEPQIGGNRLGRVPFVFCNAMDLVADPAKPPLLGLGQRCVTIYRAEADYRQSLFLQGQETLFVIGGGEDQDDVAVGAHAVNHLPMGATAEYVGVSADGLEEQREALQNDTKLAAEMGSRLVSYDDEGSSASGESLKVRVAAKTPTLTGIAQTGAAALEEALRIMAEWMGVTGEISVTPNTDFFEEKFAGREVLELQTAKMSGAPISAETIHANMRRRDLTQMTYEEELDAIENEPPLVPGGLPEDG